MGAVIKFPSKNPSETKIAFEKIMNDILVNDNSPITDIASNPFFNYKGIVKNDEFICLVTANNELEHVAAPVTQTSEAVFGQIGEDFSAFTAVDLCLNSSVDDLLDKNPSEILMNGFNVCVHTEANNSALGKLRKLAEKKKA